MNQVNKEKNEDFIRRMKKWASSQQEEALLLLESGAPPLRSADNFYSFKANPTFSYLSGIDIENCVLMVATNPVETILFIPARDEKKVLWEGADFAVEEALALKRFDHVFPRHLLGEKLPEWLEKHSQVHYLFSAQQDFFLKEISPLISDLKGQRKKAPHQLIDANYTLGRMRQIKSEEEVAIMRKSCEIAAKAHRAAMAFTRPGRHEYEIEAMLDFVFKSSGAQGPAYHPIVAAGNNANTLHYHKNASLIEESDWLLIDAGCEYANYASDITRTFPANGVFSPAERDLYEVVLKAQEEAISLVRPGALLSEIHQKTAMKLIEGLIELKICSGTAEEIYENQKYKTYYPHGTGHWLGRDVHDTSPYKDLLGKELSLEAGMVLTIEPGLYLSKNDDQVPPLWRGKGVRIEDNILVTSDGSENLTLDAPKSCQQIEVACSEDYREFL